MYSRYLAATLALIPLVMIAATNPDSPYGICAHITRHGEFQIMEAELKLMQHANIAWVRSDFDWGRIQKDPDSWSYDHLDTVAANAAKANIMVLPILDYNNSFANPAFKHLDLWAAYVKRTVERYHHQMPVWEVWNEQNLKQFWRDPNPADYLPLLQRSYQTIKAVNPKLQVAVGGYAGVPFKYIEDLYKLGGAPWFDIMNIHPYSHPYAPEERLEKQLSELRTIMARYNDEKKPIWITEIGWPTQKHRPAAPGLIKAGLKAAWPERTTPWRMVMIDDPEFSETSAPSDQMLRNELPQGTQLMRLNYDAFAAAIREGKADAVILPFDERFPSEHFNDLLAFVRDGGTLIEFGGMPIWEPRVRNQHGVWEKENKDGALYRHQLRIADEAWWHNKKLIPDKMKGNFCGPAADLPLPPEGLQIERFLKPINFREGDQFIPLIQGKHGDYTGTSAALYKFNSDFKGAIIVSALFESGHRGSTEEKQAAMTARAYLISLRLGVERIFWYELQSPEVKDLDQESHFGLTHRDLSPKPAWHAYCQLTRQRPSGSTNLELPWKSDNNAIYYPQWERPDKVKAGALWAFKQQGNYTLRFSNASARFSTWDGRPLSVNWQGNRCTLKLTGHPIYFTGATLEAVE